MIASGILNFTPRARKLLTVMVLAVTATTAPLAFRGPTLIIWNASASVPIGLYLVQPHANLQTGDLAVTALPDAARKLAADRRYLPPDVLLIKPVAATAGAEICRYANHIYVDGARIGGAQAYDRLHRSLPDWQGCQVVAPSDIFLMNPDVTDSFDGRYFGPIRRDLGRGRAIPLLTFHRSKSV